MYYAENYRDACNGHFDPVHLNIQDDMSVNIITSEVMDTYI